jgi:hypothetical protein
MVRIKAAVASSITMNLIFMLVMQYRTPRGTRSSDTAIQATKDLLHTRTDVLEKISTFSSREYR